MKKSDKYPYRPYSNALTKGDDWIMQNNDFERLLENWQAANRKRRAA